LSSKDLVYFCNLLFAVNCWPNEVGSKCDVNIEYSLENTEMELNDIVITIPLPYVNSYFRKEMILSLTVTFAISSDAFSCF